MVKSIVSSVLMLAFGVTCAQTSLAGSGCSFSEAENNLIQLKDPDLSLSPMTVGGVDRIPYGPSATCRILTSIEVSQSTLNSLSAIVDLVLEPNFQEIEVASNSDVQFNYDGFAFDSEKIKNLRPIQVRECVSGSSKNLVAFLRVNAKARVDLHGAKSSYAIVLPVVSRPDHQPLTISEIQSVLCRARD